MTPARPPEPIVHVDMDAFYASVEIRRDPALAGQPVLVGGTGGRGVVASASYEARASGVRSAMPMARALRLCPDAVVLPPDFSAYLAVSAQLRDLFLSVTPLVEPLSLDEAFLDVGGALRVHGSPPEIGARLRQRIRDELALPASVGVAANKFLAKLCSEKAKPDGLLHLPAGDAAGFLAPLDVRDLWGVGEDTAARLNRFGLRTVADLAGAPPATLARIVGGVAAAQLQRLARGEDERAVVPHEPAKQVSAEETFEQDVDDPERLRTELLRLAEKVGRRLRAAGLAGRTVTLKLRYANFATVTRSRTLQRPTDRSGDLHATVCDLLDSLRLGRAGGAGGSGPRPAGGAGGSGPRHARVRLLGVGVSNLAPAGAARQLDLLADERWGELDRAADGARARFGDAAVTRGALLEREPYAPGHE